LSHSTSPVLCWVFFEMEDHSSKPAPKQKVC
jgi:hypothetical protein